MGSLSNLEMVYAVNTFIKTLGYSAIALSAYTPKLQLDIPFFFRINMTLRSFVITEIAGLLIVGTNLRYEASLLNTSLRREQNTGGFVFSTIGAFSPQAYNHTHQGNSMRTVFNYVENRVGFVKSFINSNLPFGILLSVNALRNNYAYFIQKIIYSLGKLFFIKTNKKDRIGFIHSNVGSLAFSHLGVYSKNTSFDSFAEKEYSLFIAGQNSNKLN
jgi:NADH dehydrogenase/NADH:ubiquinone oxidoreductase subunit G